MFKCRNVIMFECWNGTKDKLMWWRVFTHKCSSAERSSHLNVETEPRIKWYDVVEGTQVIRHNGFKCKKVITLECWNWTKDKVVWWKWPMHKCFKCKKVIMPECWNWTKDLDICLYIKWLKKSRYCCTVVIFNKLSQR